MSINIVLPLILLIIPINALQIPFIRDVIFVPVSNSSGMTITNQTCIQCLCNSSTSDLILNCLPNDTCHYFYTFPRTYKIQHFSNARLYFPQRILPNASQCCMPNLTLVLHKLTTAIPINSTIVQPRCLAIDNHGYVVTISQSNSSIARLDPTNMTLINRIAGLVSSPSTLAYYKEKYYIGVGNRILVVDSNTLTIQNNITSLNLTGTRDIMFLNEGNTMVVASTANAWLLFFNRTNNVSTNYNYAYGQPLNYVYPHGLYYINDSFFYATSYAANAVYSYSPIENSTLWQQTLVFNATPWAPLSNGNHIAIDECGRFWFSLGPYGLKIFDDQGSYLDSFTFNNESIFDTIITENYVMYLSDMTSKKITRIDPNIQC